MIYYQARNVYNIRLVLDIISSTEIQIWDSTYNSNKYF